MAEKLKIGDIVQLKSGGPKMTVTRLSDNEKVAHTSWFAGSKHEAGGFPVDALIPITEGVKEK